MKVLKNNYNGNISPTIEDKKIEPYPRQIVCCECDSELEYEKSDLEMGVLGCMHLKCPLCGYNIMVEENEGSIVLNANNVEFPVHFFHSSAKTGAVDCCNNEEIRKNIKRAVEYFRKNKEEYNWNTEYGNLCFNVYRYEGDENYYVTVSENYYSTYIPFEPEDY